MEESNDDRDLGLILGILNNGVTFAELERGADAA